MGTVAAAGTERRAVAEMEEVAAVGIVAAEETEEAAVAEIAEAAGDMAGDTEPAAAYLRGRFLLLGISRSDGMFSQLHRH